MSALWLTAITARGVSASSRQGLRHAGAAYLDRPLRHALDRSLPKASRTGRNFLALCGASVAEVIDESGFDRGHDRACGNCVKATVCSVCGEPLTDALHTVATCPSYRAADGKR